MDFQSSVQPGSVAPAIRPWLRDRHREGDWRDPDREDSQDPLHDVVHERAKHLCCVACGTPVTTVAERTSQAGRHEHVCQNPEGVVFRIGCFAAAPGCVMIGRPTSHWTWFPGSRWRVALCGRCGAHLGWQFRDGGGGVFFGLIVDRLRECEGPKGY